MSNVVTLAGLPMPEPGEVCPELVKVLEMMLEKAKSGEVNSFVGTGFYTNGMPYNVMAIGTSNALSLIGSLEWLKRSYMDLLLLTDEL